MLCAFGRKTLLRWHRDPPTVVDAPGSLWSPATPRTSGHCGRRPMLVALSRVCLRPAALRGVGGGALAPGWIGSAWHGDALALSQRGSHVTSPATRSRCRLVVGNRRNPRSGGATAAANKAAH